LTTVGPQLRFSRFDIRRSLRELRWQMDPVAWLQLASVLSVFVAFMIAPLLLVSYRALTYQGSISAYWFGFILSDPFYWPLSFMLQPNFPFIALQGVSGELFTLSGGTLTIGRIDFGVIPNTLIVATFTTLFSSVIGFILAFIFARYRFFGSSALRIAVLLPLLSTPFVGAIGLKRMIIPNGVLNNLLVGILPYRFEITGLAAMVLVQTLLFYPIVFLNSYTALVNIDPSQEEQAENLGASRFRLFRTVTLPLATPGLEAGALLVFILSLEDLGTPIIFAGTSAEKVLTYQIFKRFSPSGFISEEAMALSLLLLAIAIVIFVAIRRYVSLKRYAMLSKGGAWHPRSSKLSKKATLGVYALVLAILFVATLPHVGVLLLAFAGQWGSGLLPDWFTLNNFVKVFERPDLFSYILNSFEYSALATFIIVILGVSAAYLVSRKKVVGMGALDTLVTLPIAVPGIVIAAGLFLLFLPTAISPLVSAAPLLVISYTVRKFPFTVRAAFSGLEQTDKAMDEAAVAMGASRARTFYTIIIPLVMMNVLAGGMLSFIYSMSEVSTSILIGAANPPTAPWTFGMYNTLYGLGGGVFQAAAMGVLLMVLQFFALTVANVILRRRATALLAIS
jgi:iron(III) transport system permease protein